MVKFVTITLSKSVIRCCVNDDFLALRVHEAERDDDENTGSVCRPAGLWTAGSWYKECIGFQYHQMTEMIRFDAEWNFLL